MSYLVVGLGNPGRKYARTRHNTGFIIADELGKRFDAPFIEKKHYALAEGEINGFPLFIIKPQTFMNLSGRAVADFLRNREISPRHMYVAYDDLDLPVGKLRFRWSGAGGGHKGIRSIIQETGSRDFFHVRVGIDKPPLKELVDGYVLGTFSPDERTVIGEAVDRAVDCIIMSIVDSPERAMNLFNG